MCAQRGFNEDLGRRRITALLTVFERQNAIGRALIAAQIAAPLVAGFVKKTQVCSKKQQLTLVL